MRDYRYYWISRSATARDRHGSTGATRATQATYTTYVALHEHLHA